MNNAYIATDGETLLKIGKTNNVKRREKEIALSVTFTVACLDEAAAFRVENQLRRFVIEQGGIRHQSTIDWFQFDTQIYTMLCEFATTLDAQTIIVPEPSLDEEILELQNRYHQLLATEAEIARLRRERDAALTEIERIRNQLETERRKWCDELEAERRGRREDNINATTELRRLEREIGHLQGIFEMLRKGDGKNSPISLSETHLPNPTQNINIT